MPGVVVAGNSFVAAAVQVTTAAAKLLEQITSGRKNITIQNLGPNDIFIGSTNAVTTANGLKVSANGGTWAVDLKNGSQVWAIAATADQVSPADTRVVEVR